MKKKFLKLPKIPINFKDGYYAEIYSGSEIVLTGYFEIEELQDTVLRLKCFEHHINIYGKKIKIINYTSDGIRIDGVFDKIEL